MAQSEVPGASWRRAESRPPVTTPRRVRLRLAFALFGFLVCVLCLLSKGRIVVSDGQSMYAVTEAIVERGSFSVDCGSAGEVRGRGGQCFSKYGIGLSIVNVPFYFVGRAISVLLPKYPRRYFTMFAVSFQNAFITAALCATLFLFLCYLGYARRLSVALCLAYVFGTYAMEYAKDDFSEPLVSWMLLCSIFCLLVWQKTRKPLVASGAALSLGIAIAARPIAVIVVPAELAYFGAVCSCDLRRLALKEVAFSISSFLAIMMCASAVLGWYNVSRFGSPLATGYGEDGIRAFCPLPSHWGPHFVANLFSFAKGWVWYAPVIWVVPVGAVAFYRKRPQYTVLIAGISVVWLVLHSMYRYWDGGWCWGPRFLLPLLPLLMAFPAEFVDMHTPWNPTRRAYVVVALGTLGFLVQLPAEVVSYRRPFYQAAIQRAHGASIDWIWDVRQSPLTRQWRSVREVLMLPLDRKTALRYEARDVSMDQYVQTSAGLNLPDFWWVHLPRLGVPRGFVWTAVGALLMLAVWCLRAMLKLALSELSDASSESDIGLTIDSASTEAPCSGRALP